MRVSELRACSILLTLFVALVGMGCDEEPAESEVAGCQANAECEAADYCETSLGDCGGVGDCSIMPTGCPLVWDPVCGCDSMTYGNACEAAAAGVNVDGTGECPPPTCARNDDCNAGHYCEKLAGDCAGTGQCWPIPPLCVVGPDPVCGCNGVTYENACKAAQSGVNVASQGACACTQHEECAYGQYCEKDAGDCSGTGECVPPPELCPLVWDPVCSCDASTYTNACYAAQAGVNVASQGECALGACHETASCDPGDYCGKPVGDCQGVGQCLLEPVACRDVYVPVCGCDGGTYSNACDAYLNGVSVASEGQCP
jgi:hypothetical protein